MEIPILHWKISPISNFFMDGAMGIFKGVLFRGGAIAAVAFMTFGSMVLVAMGRIFDILLIYTSTKKISN
jgi:hypothetical protein